MNVMTGMKLPGLLANSNICPGNDPRIDRRLRQVLTEYGLSELVPLPAVSRRDEMAKMLEAVGQANAGFNLLYDVLPNDLPGDVTIDYETHVIKGVDDNDITLRVYRPDGLNGKQAPGILYIHGGGMVILDAFAKVHERWCQDIAASGLIAIAVEFRNAYSESGFLPFPAGLNDCFSAVKWVAENKAKLGISKLVIQGESGGANLTLATAILAKREGCADLIDGVYACVPYISGAYGWNQDRMLAELPSLVENDGFFVRCAAMDHLVFAYDPDGANAENPLTWPYFAKVSDLEGLPPHVITVCELDPLRDEGLEYYRKLMEAGVQARAHTELGLIHAANFIFRKAMPDRYFANLADINHFANSL